LLELSFALERLASTDRLKNSRRRGENPEGRMTAE